MSKLKKEKFEKFDVKERALRFHQSHQGKYEIQSKVPLSSAEAAASTGISSKRILAQPSSLSGREARMSSMIFSISMFSMANSSLSPSIPEGVLPGDGQ